MSDRLYADMWKIILPYLIYLALNGDRLIISRRAFLFIYGLFNHIYGSDYIAPKGRVKVKVKCTLVQALRLCTGRTAYRGSRRRLGWLMKNIGDSAKGHGLGFI